MFSTILVFVCLANVNALLSPVKFPTPEQPPGTPCSTPMYSEGKCIDLRECPYILSMLLARTNLEYVRIATCSFDGFIPFVCCPSSNFSTNVTLDSTKSSSLLDKKSGLIHETCGQTIFTRIVGGKITELGSWPWIAALGYKERNRNLTMFLCGGTLINRRYVITAAHCLDSKLLPIGTKLSFVRLGEYDLSQVRDCRLDRQNGERSCYTAEDVMVEETITHEGWSRTKTEVVNDIALVRLAQDAPFGDNIQPICLPFPEIIDLNLQNEPYPVDPYVAGWGLTRPDSYFVKGTDILREVRLPVVPLEQCKGVEYYRKYTLYSSHLCAGGQEGKDSCKGDSGGGLIIPNKYGSQWFLLGVVSFGPLECGKEGVPGIYTRVTEYLDWILERIK